MNSSHPDVLVRDNHDFPSYPLIIANSKVVSLKKLNALALKDVREITVLDVSKAQVLYGVAAMQGAIILTGKPKLFKKLY